jgi:hypothetical protein
MDQAFRYFAFLRQASAISTTLCCQQDPQNSAGFQLAHQLWKRRTPTGKRVEGKRTEPSIGTFGDGGKQFVPTVSLRLRHPRGGAQPR